ncbi:hypothetical protein [Agrococcus sp. DT81.2]|uniref:hypothetical protein n=1 Tax=Agrococcus sp. DT81.2 TaxID=3393414 RepID=UPI003CE45D8E
MIEHRIRSAAAALVVAAGLVVTGCASTPPPVPTLESPTPTAEERSQAEQCAQLVSDVQGIAGDVPRVAEMLGTDPFGALALVGDISNRVGQLHVRITDPELLQRIAQIQADWDAIVQDATDSLGSGDLTAIERIGASLSELGQRVSELQQLCVGTP